MDNFITDLHIKNFKSVKDLSLKCKRVNIFVGKPNTGKSNILEALSLFCAPYDLNKGFLLKDFIRYEKFSNLFYDNEISEPIEIISNTETAIINRGKDFYWYFSSGDPNIVRGYLNSTAKEAFHRALKEKDDKYFYKMTSFLNIGEDGSMPEKPSGNNASENPVKKYVFNNSTFTLGQHYLYLTPPNGSNLPAIVQMNKSLREDISSYFKEYGLNFVLRIGENNVEIQKRMENFAWTYPYSLTSDTLQRMIFYLAAVKSNTGSILLFEEPETRLFPSFITDIAKAIAQSKENQFFMTTHNSCIIENILEGSGDDVAVFEVSYKDYQTCAQELTQEEVLNIKKAGLAVV